MRGRGSFRANSGGIGFCGIQHIGTISSNSTVIDGYHNITGYQGIEELTKNCAAAPKQQHKVRLGFGLWNLYILYPLQTLNQKT